MVSSVSPQDVQNQPRPKQRRLFFAWWPSAEVQNTLHQIGEQRLSGKHGRLTKEHKIHLTLAFLGPVGVETTQCVKRVASGIRWQPFSLTFDRLGWFARSRVMWVGGSELPTPLADLVARLQEELKLCGYTPEHRRFQAHLTLARKVNRPPSETELEPIECPFEQFALVQSTLDEHGATYETLATFAAD